MSGERSGPKLRRRTVLASTAVTATGFAGCNFLPGSGNDSNESDTQQSSQLTLDGCRAPTVALGDWGTNGVKPDTMSLFGDEIGAALDSINNAIGTNLSYTGDVPLPPSDMGQIVGNAGAGATQRDLAIAAAEGLAKQVDSNDDVEPGMHLIVPHNAGGTSETASASVPVAWKNGDTTIAHQVDGDYYFVTTLGSTFLMDVTGYEPETMGREMEAWQAVGRLLGASTFDGGYSTEMRDGREVIVDISPMATRHTFGKYGGKDAARRPYSAPRMNAANVTYDDTRGQTIFESTGEPVAEPDFASDRQTAIPADAEHLYGRPANTFAAERFGRYETEDGDVRAVMQENHIKAYTATALDAIERTLTGEPSTFDESRPPRPQTRCGALCDAISGTVTETFEDGAALPDESGNSEGMEWKVIRSQGDFAAITAELVDTDVPGDGTHALTLSETTGGGTSGAVATVQSYPGWNCEWTLTAQFYTRNLDTSKRFQGHSLGISVDDVEGGISLNVGFTRPGRAFELVIAGGETETRAEPEWSEETWYNIGITHDGDGRYEARVWPATGNRPDEAMTVASGNTFDNYGRPVLSINGAFNEPFQVNYSRISWEI